MLRMTEYEGGAMKPLTLCHGCRTHLSLSSIFLYSDAKEAGNGINGKEPTSPLHLPARPAGAHPHPIGGEQVMPHT